MTLDIKITQTRKHRDNYFIDYSFSGYDGIGNVEDLKVELYGDANHLKTNEHDGILSNSGSFKFTKDEMKGCKDLAIVASIGDERAMDKTTAKDLDSKDKGGRGR